MMKCSVWRIEWILHVVYYKFDDNSLMAYKKASAGVGSDAIILSDSW